MQSVTLRRRRKPRLQDVAANPRLRVSDVSIKPTPSSNLILRPVDSNNGEGRQYISVVEALIPTFSHNLNCYLVGL